MIVYLKICCSTPAELELIISRSAFFIYVYEDFIEDTEGCNLLNTSKPVDVFTSIHASCMLLCVCKKKKKKQENYTLR